MQRIVQPEILDSMPPDAPEAVRSRADLRRLNRIMGHTGHLSGPLRRFASRQSSGSRPRIAELGSGDGTLMLRVASRLSSLGLKANLTLVDRHPQMSPATRDEFHALGWTVDEVKADALDWLGGPGRGVEVILANLFLHHFQHDALADLLRRAAEATRLFVACEPRRSRLALASAHMLGCIGCNRVTRHDAVVSVRAGFSGSDLTRLWPASGRWQTLEQPAGLFSHRFVASLDE